MYCRPTNNQVGIQKQKRRYVLVSISPKLRYNKTLLETWDNVALLFVPKVLRQPDWLVSTSINYFINKCADLSLIA